MLKANNSDHDAEVQALNDKIETLQSSSRTNLSIIESNNKRDQTVTEELTKQHQRNVELGREITAIQQSEQNAKGQLNSAKYREDSLQQQLDLARRSSEWFENELKTKSDEALKYRKEKGARIAELQRQNEDSRSQVEALQRTEKQLRERLDAMQAKADEVLVKLQKQEGTFAATVDSYKQELEDQKRLVGMTQQLSSKHQDRVRELEAEKERLQDNYENELRRVRVELEQERQATSQMEDRIRQLESDLEEAQIRVEQGPPPGSAPQTPRANGSFAARAASPFATPGSVRSKSAVTATQAIEQLYQVKGQLASEKRRSQQLSEELDNMIAALEAKAPEIQDLQSEAEMLRAEIARMSELSQQSFEERDNSRRAARKAEASLSTAQSEANILKTQLRDLGTQIQMLVFNVYALEKGLDQLTDEEKFRIQQLERGEITEDALADMSDTHQFITQKLLVFKDVQSLQTKNEELMRITRELADQLESEEALAAKHLAKEDHDLVLKLRQELEHMTEETNSVRNTMQSYKMERDMFRRLLQQRGVGGDEAYMMRSSFDGGQRPPLLSIESADQVETLNEALRKMQTEYDGFREAQDGVRKDFRNQIDHLSSERNSLQTDNVKLQGEARLELERREMLQSNYAALQGENRELQKRSQSLSETAARQDIRTQQVAEELIEARGLLDSTRNEIANLKAEKTLWKDIQDRMSKDNEGLIEEKNRLNHLLATQQSLENERNISESEARRKAQAKVESLEIEFSEVQRKLTYEVEESKKLQLRKEYEAKEAQKRIDELMASLSQIREDHISVRTSRDHLQARVDELTVELRSAEERVGRLQPRPTPRPTAAADNNQQEEELEAEIRDLHNEVTDLKRDYELAKTHLENAKTQAEQYKELSQGNEEALEDLRSSQDQYREEMEGLIAEKDNKIKEFGQRTDDMSTELSRSNTELSTLRDSQGEVARKYEDEKVILEEELNRLKEETARHVEAARYHQQDLRAQADIASKAQQDYEQELVRHADAAKVVQHLRVEYNELKSQAASSRTEAESARVTLAQSESSWEDRRMQLEQEMAELKTRREDVNAQNKLLHQQLEGLTTQVAAMQQKRRSSGGDDEAMSPVAVGDATEGLRELNGYLRREKEILEVQYDLKSQESRRLQQQLEYTQSSLDEARLKLDQERTQTAHSGRASMAHQDLMEKLNELNLYRESSAALRSENNHLKDQVSEKTKKIEELESKVHPLEAEIDTLKTQKSFLEEEIKQVQEDRDRWQKRTEGILTKYGRVDPEEMQDLKQTITSLENERNALKEGEQPLRTKVTELESTLETERTNWQNTRERLTDQFKERSRKITGERNEASQRANGLQEQLKHVNSELEGAQKRADEAGSQTSELEKQVQAFKQQVDELRQQAQQNNQAGGGSAVAAAGQPVEASASEGVVAQLQEQLGTAQNELQTVNAQKVAAEQQLESIRGELRQAISERDEAAQKLQEAAAAQQSAASSGQPAPVVGSSEEAGNATVNGTAGLSDVEKKALEEKVTAAEAKAAEFEAKANEVEAKIQSTIKERSDRMRDTLNNKLREARGKMEDEFKQQNEELRVRFEQDKAIWFAENQKGGAAPATATAPDQQPPATPSKADQPQVPSTQGTPAVTDPSGLDDHGIRQFLSTNATVKGIVAGNIKKRLESESAKLKSEWEGKVASAREQAQLMESKKSTLRINMAENKLKVAQVKIGVVETAASETPQMPVVEVWEKAKTAQPPPASATPATPSAARPAPARQPSSAGVAQAAPATSAGGSAKTTAPGTGSGEVKQEQPAQAGTTGATAAKTSPATGAQAAQAQQQQQPGRTGIPVARGGGRGRGGGAHATQSQRAASGNQEGASPAAGRGGRGGRGGGRGGLNPVVSDFQPGNKRPRGDSEVGSGAKRARGAH